MSSLADLDNAAKVPILVQFHSHLWAREPCSVCSSHVQLSQQCFPAQKAQHPTVGVMAEIPLVKERPTPSLDIFQCALISSAQIYLPPLKLCLFYKRNFRPLFSFLTSPAQSSHSSWVADTPAELLEGFPQEEMGIQPGTSHVDFKKSLWAPALSSAIRGCGLEQKYYQL